jgi:hypothetical protein
LAASTTPKTQIMAETEYCPISFFWPHVGICYCPLGPKASVSETTNNFFLLMLRAQIGQCAVFKTPTKLQHPSCNSYEAIAIAKLDLVLDRRNVSLFRDLVMKPIFTPRISQPLNILSIYLVSTGVYNCTCIYIFSRYRYRYNTIWYM